MKHRGFFPAALVATIVLAVVATAIGLDVARANGYLQWDDAQYLYRGIYHARQVSKHSHLLLPRLAFSLSFESPKPPLYTGWIALGALLLGYREVPALLFWSTAPVFLALLLLVFATARKLGGTFAGCLAVGCALSFSGVLLYGGSLMVEAMLAFWILAVIVLAAAWCGAPSPARSMLLGAAIGFALLTKVSAGVFLAPVVVYAGVAVTRRLGWPAAWRTGTVVALSAAAVCGFWYFKHLSEAVEFARYASRFSDFAPRASFPARVTQIVREVFGWWWAVILPLLLFGTARRNEPPRSLPTEIDFRRMAFLAAGFGFVVISFARYFEARFFMPITPAFAVLAGAAGASFFRSRSGFAVAGFALVAGGLVLSVRQYGARKPAPAIGGMTRVLESLQGEFGRPLRLGLVGNDATFNLYRVELANVLRLTFADASFEPLDDRAGAGRASFEGVDAVLAFANCPGASDGNPTSGYVNRNCGALRAALEKRTSSDRRRIVRVSDSASALELFDLRAAAAPEQTGEPNLE